MLLAGRQGAARLREQVSLPSVKALRSVPGASRSGFTRPSRVGPLEEKEARLAKALASGGASEKETVSFPPACAPRFVHRQSETNSCEGA